jgi:hypothetical protein
MDVYLEVRPQTFARDEYILRQTWQKGVAKSPRIQRQGHNELRNFTKITSALPPKRFRHRTSRDSGSLPHASPTWLG